MVFQYSFLFLGLIGSAQCFGLTLWVIRICLGKLTFPFDFLNNSMDFQRCQLGNWNIRDLRVDFVGLNKNIAEFLLISTKSRIPEAKIRGHRRGFVIFYDIYGEKRPRFLLAFSASI